MSNSNIFVFGGIVGLVLISIGWMEYREVKELDKDINEFNKNLHDLDRSINQINGKLKTMRNESYFKHKSKSSSTRKSSTRKSSRRKSI
jgi:hypothetical protein